MRSRYLLAIGDLNKFRDYLLELGFIQEQIKGDYEVLRMRPFDGSAPLLVYTKLDAKEHHTVYGDGIKYVRSFIDQKHNAGN